LVGLVVVVLEQAVLLGLAAQEYFIFSIRSKQ
jgi:hypothetical protein